MSNNRNQAIFGNRTLFISIEIIFLESLSFSLDLFQRCGLMLHLFKYTQKIFT
jgi:hypothetical protein